MEMILNDLSNHQDHLTTISSSKSEADYDQETTNNDEVGKVDLDDFGELIDKYLKLEVFKHRMYSFYLLIINSTSFKMSFIRSSRCLPFFNCLRKFL